MHMATDASLTLGQAGGVGAIGIALAVFLGAVAGALGAVIGLRFVMGLTLRKAREEAEGLVRVAKAEAEAEAQRASLEG